MAVDLFRAGGSAADLVTATFFLWGKVETAGNVTHLRKEGTTVGYQVTSGKTLYMVNMRIQPVEIGTPACQLKMGYADNDVGLDTATARTNPVMAFGLDDTGVNGFPFWGLHSASAGSGNTDLWFFGDDPSAFLWPIAASLKFPFARMISATVVRGGLTVACVEL